MASETFPSWVQGLWGAVQSVRLTIAVFLLLAAASIVGTLVPQNQPPDDYMRIYGVVAGRLFKALGITDLYHSSWFLGLMGILVINLVACSLHRFPPAWRAIHTPQRRLTDRLWSSLPVRRGLEGNGAPELLVGEIRQGLSERHWSFREEREEETFHLVCQKGRYGRMGVFVTHLGVVVILLGAAIGSIFGFKGFVQIHEGETVERVQDRQRNGWRALGFQLRCDAFRMSTYPDGTPKEYRSDLTFLESGQVTKQGPIRVNHPIEHAGFTFYQSSYGSSAKVTLEASNDGRAPVRQLTLELGETANLDPQGKSLVRPLRFEPDLQGRGPAVLLAFMQAGGHPLGGWLFKGERSDALPGLSVRFLDAAERRWTGLQVKRDPGVWVVWVGCFLVMGGCAMAFLLTHRRLWVRIRRVQGRTVCQVAASTTKGRHGLDAVVDDLCRAWGRAAGLHVTDRKGANG